MTERSGAESGACANCCWLCVVAVGASAVGGRASWRGAPNSICIPVVNRRCPRAASRNPPIRRDAGTCARGEHRTAGVARHAPLGRASGVGEGERKSLLSCSVNVAVGSIAIFTIWGCGHGTAGYSSLLRPSGASFRCQKM